LNNSQGTNAPENTFAKMRLDPQLNGEVLLKILSRRLEARRRQLLLLQYDVGHVLVRIKGYTERGVEIFTSLEPHWAERRARNG
jgi:hypothetical protein